MNEEYKTNRNSDLRKLCIENDWFTCGCNQQYQKLFTAYWEGAPLEEIATIIWVCSENCCRRDILYILKENEKNFLQE